MKIQENLFDNSSDDSAASTGGISFEELDADAAASYAGDAKPDIPNPKPPAHEESDAAASCRTPSNARSSNASGALETPRSTSTFGIEAEGMGEVALELGETLDKVATAIDSFHSELTRDVSPILNDETTICEGTTYSNLVRRDMVPTVPSLVTRSNDGVFPVIPSQTPVQEIVFRDKSLAVTSNMRREGNQDAAVSAEFMASSSLPPLPRPSNQFSRAPSCATILTEERTMASLVPASLCVCGWKNCKVYQKAFSVTQHEYWDGVVTIVMTKSNVLAKALKDAMDRTLNVVPENRAWNVCNDTDERVAFYTVARHHFTVAHLKRYISDPVNHCFVRPFTRQEAEECSYKVDDANKVLSCGQVLYLQVPDNPKEVVKAHFNRIKKQIKGASQTIDTQAAVSSQTESQEALPEEDVSEMKEAIASTRDEGGRLEQYVGITMYETEENATIETVKEREACVQLETGAKESEENTSTRSVAEPGAQPVSTEPESPSNQDDQDMTEANKQENYPRDSDDTEGAAKVQDGEDTENQTESSVPATKDSVAPGPTVDATPTAVETDEVHTVGTAPTTQGLDTTKDKVVAPTAQGLDTVKLLSLVQKSSAWGCSIDGSDVILLIGMTGAGKTTTLLHCAGASFEEIEVDGIFHLEPSHDSLDLARFRTSAGVDSVTDAVQSVTTKLDGRQLVICDTPGFQDTRNEQEIANRVGLIRALYRARSVRPVLVLGIDGFGSRLTGLKQTLDEVATMTATVDFAAFAYAFTKCESDSWKTRIPKRLEALRKSLAAQDNARLVSLLDDMISKTSGGAALIKPLDEAPEETLRSLLGNHDEWITDTKAFFHSMLPESAANRLRVALYQLTKSVETGITEQDLEKAGDAMARLQEFENMLPKIAGSFAESGCQLVVKFVTQRVSTVESLISRLGSLDRTDLRLTKDVYSEIRGQLKLLSRTQSLCQLCRIDEALSLKDVINRVVLPFQEAAANSTESLSTESVAAHYSTFRWHLACLLGSQEALSEFLGSDDATSKYGCELNKLTAGIDCALGAAETMIETGQLDMPHLEGSIKFLAKAWRDLEQRDIVGESEGDFAWVRLRIVEVQSGLDTALKGSWNMVSSARDALQNAVLIPADARSVDTVVDLNCADLIAARNTLANLDAFPSLVAVLDTVVVAQVPDLMHSFDVSLKEYLAAAASDAESKARTFVESGIAGSDFATRRNETKILLEKLHQTCVVCQSFKSCVEIDNSWESMIGTKKLLEMYSTALDEESVALVHGVNGAFAAAAEFLAKLESRAFPDHGLLSELSQADKWECWISLLPDQKSKSVVGRLSGIWQNLSGSKKSRIGGLKSTLTKITEELRKYLVNSFSRISSQNASAGSMAEAKFVLQDAALDVLLCLEYLKLKPSSSLYLWVYQADMAGLIDRGQEALVRLFHGVSTLPDEVLAKRDFCTMSRLLSLWDQAVQSSFWCLASSFSLAESEALVSLSEQISACVTYDSLLRKTQDAILDLEKRLNTITLDSMTRATNGLERSSFYTHVADLIASASGLSTLGPYLGNGKDLQEIFTRSSQRIVTEIGKISGKLVDLVETFPTKDEDFPLMSSLIGNLDSIHVAFRDALPEAADQATVSLGLFHSSFYDKLTRLGLVASSSNRELVTDILMLKKAVRAIPRLSQPINDCIDCRLAALVEEKGNGCLLDVSLSLRAETDAVRAPLAKQVLSEHKCFEGAANCLFNQDTSRQGIGYILRNLKLGRGDTHRLAAMYEGFESEYNRLVLEGLVAYRKDGDDALHEYLCALVLFAKELLCDFSTTYEAQLVAISAHVFALWTLKRSNSFATAGSTTEEAFPYLMQPHSAQVVAVWILLNCGVSGEEETHQCLANQLVQLATGEGKSVVLGITATILAMFGWPVDCVCYSSYLSGRDNMAFRDVFQAFGVEDMVWYGTLNDLTSRMVGSYCKDVYQLFKRRTIEENPQRRRKAEARVLLFDEVDVFFKDEVFGQKVRPTLDLQNEKVLEYFIFLFENKPALDDRQVRERIRSAVSDYPSELRRAVEKELKDAVGIAPIFHKLNVDYEVRDGEIAYKYMDGFSTTIRYGHWTTFTFIKEWKNQRLTFEEMKASVTLLPTVGQLSPAEFPFGYEVVLGVTGTLEGLGTKERDVLKNRYAIDRYAFVPSVFGDKHLAFDPENPSDVVVCGSSDDYHLRLANMIRTRRCPSSTGEVLRPVLVFFDTKKELEAFYNSPPMQQLKSYTQTITEHIPEWEKDAVFSNATTQGAISLLIREYGRGTDFKAYDTIMLNAGGVHVIQAFFSVDISEEIQIKGRCARQGKPGSYSMVINFDQLCRDLELNQSDLDRLLGDANKQYSFLNSVRNDRFNKLVENRLKLVDEVEALHYRTLACRDAIAGNNNAQRDAMRFICELNGCTKTTAFAANDIKQRMLQERQQRLQTRITEDQEKRQAARRQNDAVSVQQTIFHGQEHED